MPIGTPFGPDDREAFLELVANQGLSIASAATELGFSPRTVKRHLQDDVEFREALAEAEEIALGRVEDVVYSEAVDHHSAWAVKLWLANRAPRGRWVDERDRNAGSPGGGISSPTLITAAIREALTDGTTRDSAIVALTSVPLPAIETTGRETV